jgi:hypothetical protein
LDQPTTDGDRQPTNATALHSKFMTSGVAKSLTHSDGRLWFEARGRCSWQCCGRLFLLHVDEPVVRHAGLLCHRDVEGSS